MSEATLISRRVPGDDGERPVLCVAGQISRERQPTALEHVANTLQACLSAENGRTTSYFSPSALPRNGNGKIARNAIHFEIPPVSLTC
ncbi:hypothetical protein [Pseudomonas sp. KNUC1026]|uniref:hypothetical protein n=1 Tax=Pseudomonas sp. KNUC1026 TaxID=2893890 RepID=UPI001F28BDF5|nr:hypothetical protein [Pseudomonas sp. KNUC1026]UFH50204.1 hypothetical protein LN139_02445 [Pseudomonas sp. KNUC1026]